MKRPGLSSHLLSATLFLLSITHLPLLAEEKMAPPSAAPKGDMAPSMAPKRMSSVEVIKRFDKNGDGKIDEDERIEAREMMMKRQLDQQAARAAAAPGGPEAFRAKLLERFDKNRDGRLDETERVEAQQYAAEHGFGPGGEVREDVIKRFDRNANGRIDEEEREAVRASLTAAAAEKKTADVSEKKTTSTAAPAKPAK